MGSATTRESNPSRPRPWPLVAVAAVAAIGFQLWGVYRVTGPPSPSWFPHADKVEHTVGFGLPVALILIAAMLRRRDLGRTSSRRLTPVVALVFVAHAVVSELIQYAFYTTRTGDPFDALADSLGVLLGVAAFWLLRRRLRGPRPGPA